jgi:hypothetical protein
MTSVETQTTTNNENSFRYVKALPTGDGGRKS